MTIEDRIKDEKLQYDIDNIMKTFNSEFQEVKVWFTDQTSKPLELEDKINITSIIK